MKRKRSGKRWLSSAVAAATAVALVLGLGAPVNRTLAKTYSETVYEAESATLHNASTNTNHTGYTGSGFVDGFSASGDYVQFSISVAAAGDYTLLFRYANDTGYKASHRVYVDGVDTALAVSEAERCGNGGERSAHRRTALRGRLGDEPDQGLERFFSR